MKRSMAVLEGYLTFGIGEDRKPLTYDRVINDLKLAAAAKEAVMDTEHDSTADTDTQFVGPR